MTSLSVEIITGIITFMVSVSTSMFVAGSRWGRVEGDIRSISDRLAKIEGMFTLKLRGHEDE